MTLIKSISGIRGTIGGLEGDNLTPVDIVKYVTLYGNYIRNVKGEDLESKIVVGRDGRMSGNFVCGIVIHTLCSLGIDVIDIGLTTTPTIEMAITNYYADGGIMITASHNPKEWNALKLLNNKGEFISDEEAKNIYNGTIDKIKYASVDKLGKRIKKYDAIDKHIEAICSLKEVDIKSISESNFRIVVDCINSTGSLIIPKLLERLGVYDIILMNDDVTGDFAHNPEPIPDNIIDVVDVVRRNKADVGFVVDPDVDRLAIVMEDGGLFGEEYTLVSIADYILSLNGGGNSVSNMSSSQALKDVTMWYGGNYYSAPVGEVNVIEEMKRRGAIIGGEGNGGVIYPKLHYGRDAVLGIALFLSLLARTGKRCSELRSKYPNYVILKEKIELKDNVNPDSILLNISRILKEKKIDIDDRDGLKVLYNKEWVHIRKSNTEPIIRIYAESNNENSAKRLIEEIKSLIYLK